MKKLVTLLFAIFTIFSAFSQSSIANWNFFTNGVSSSPTTASATVADPNLDPGILLARGASAAASAAGNSFRTTGFQNNGIATTNTDYFEFSLSAATGYNLKLTSIIGKGAGTGTYTVSPGVSQQYAYSIDGAAFTLIGSPVITIGNGIIPSIDLSGISALQNLPATSFVTFRYYATGQTGTGGWGYNSPSAAAADNGLDVSGALVNVLPVSISSFTGSYTNKTSLLKWSTGAEVNINKYAVERSTHGRTFNEIGFVNATGSTEYSYTDATAKAAVNFYRLKIVGANEIKYSAVVKILADAFGGKLNVYPSPAVSYVNAEFTSEIKSAANVQMTDVSGRILLQKSMLVQQGYNNLSFDVNTFNKGNYVLKISVGSRTISSSFSKL